MNYLRQENIVDRSKLNNSIDVIGAGAIGSYTVMNLAKMGYQGQITVYDGDRVEDHNLPNQFYPASAKGHHKAQALYSVVREYTGISIIPIVEMCAAIRENAHAVLFAVDSMDTRIALHETIKGGTRWLFDGRMGGEVMRLYTIDLQSKQDRSFYEANLYPSSEASQEKCTARAVIYNVSVIAGLLANQIKRAMSGEDYHSEIIMHLAEPTVITNKAPRLQTA